MNLFHVVITVRGAGQKSRGIFGKERSQRFSYDIGKFVFGDSVPYVEKEMAARFQDAACLPVGGDLEYSDSATLTSALSGRREL